MQAPAHESAGMLGRSSGRCKGTAAEQTLPAPGRRSSTPSELQACLPPAPRNRFHVPVRGAGEGGENDVLKRVKVLMFLIEDVQM